MSNILGGILGAACAFAFAYLISRIIAKCEFVTPRKIARERLRKAIEDARDNHPYGDVPRFAWRDEGASGTSGGGVTEHIGQPLRQCRTHRRRGL